MAFFIEVLITGLLVGIMYSLVALGFALIYKASDVFNFAQGDMSLLAGLALVGFLTIMPLWLALICTIAVMVILAYGTVFIIFRPLVARPPLILFMAAIGLSFLIQGIGQSIWGTDAKGLNIGIPDNPIIIADIYISTFDLTFGVVAAMVDQVVTQHQEPLSSVRILTATLTWVPGSVWTATKDFHSVRKR